MEDAKAWKIVLIDDEQDIRDVVSIVLEDAGYFVHAASNGDRGISLCKDVGPQIVITDIRMPGIDGIQVLQTIKKKYPDIEVIVVTAFGEMKLAVRALQLDASDFITKPIDEAVLLVALKRAQHRYAAKIQLRDYTRFLEKENVQTARELIKIYSFQKNLIESSMDGILACDENGIVVTFNKSMEHILGFKKAEVLHKKMISSLFAPGEEGKINKKIALDDFGGKNRLSLYETMMIGKTDSRVPVRMSAVILWQNGIKTGQVCFFKDLREIQKLETRLADQAGILHQDKMMSLGRLAASVVHEINNPLFGVLNYVRLMIRILDQGVFAQNSIKKFKGYLDLVEKETERCSVIISSLLTFSRKTEPLFSRVRLDELFHKCILLSSHKLELSNIDFVSQINPSLPSIKADSNQLLQCMINLIFNAVDAMPDGGTLTLACEYNSKENKVEIRLHDTGHGIKEKDISYVFDPFFTTKKEGYGVGLGLSTVYGIVDRHKGTIRVKSKPGNTVFTMHLPVHQG